MTVTQKQLILAWFGLINPRDVDGIWGSQSREATMQLQRKLGVDDDGVFGVDTKNNALKAMANGFDSNEDAAVGSWWDEIEFFDREEFRCQCGGRYCDGFPAEPDERMVRTVDALRRRLGVPITIVSGLRCPRWNEIQGGVENSQHMYGEAADIWARGKTQSAVEAELDRIGGVRYHYPIKNSNNVHFDVPKGKR